MVDMVMHQILPAALSYSSSLAESALRKKQLFGTSTTVEKDLSKRITTFCNSLYENAEKLARDLKSVPDGSLEAAQYYGSVIVNQMDKVRYDADKLEKLTGRSYWPYPIYAEMLYY